MSHIDLNEALVVTAADNGFYEGLPVPGGEKIAFGGHCAAHSLSAAAAEAGPGKLPHSLHVTFLSAVVPDMLVRYRVSWLKQGRAFSILRVDALQGGRVCLTSTVSFHGAEPGPDHQMVMPEVGPPEACLALDFVPAGTNPDVRRSFDIRAALHVALPDAEHPTQSCWLRPRQVLPTDGHLHAAALVWFSDFSMPWTADLPYIGTGPRSGASLDHALWFHRPFSANEWLLFVQESPSYAGARAYTRGTFFTRSGSLVATAVQETLLRRAPDDRPGA